MEYEATVVLEKDYLNKARRSKNDGADARPLRESGSSQDEDSGGLERGTGNPDSAEATRGAAQPRQDPLAKPGWFSRG
jgi:hypothetical protein